MLTAVRPSIGQVAATVCLQSLRRLCQNDMQQTRKGASPGRLTVTCAPTAALCSDVDLGRDDFVVLRGHLVDGPRVGAEPYHVRLAVKHFPHEQRRVFYRL